MKKQRRDTLSIYPIKEAVTVGPVDHGTDPRTAEFGIPISN